MDRSSSVSEGSTPAEPRILAVANQKGGVGKTTTAVSLGAALAEAGQRVVVVDLDPQGNASTGLGIDRSRRVLTSYDVITGRVAARDALVETMIDGLVAIPSTADLAGAEIELVGESARETSLKRALAPLLTEYPLIFLDCPPSLGLLTVNALVAATEVLVPIQCEYFALEGLGQLVQNLRLVQRNINPNLRLNGIVLTMYDGRTKLAEQVVQEIRSHFGEAVYRAVIPRSVRLSEAPGYGMPIARYDPTSKGAEAYRALASEFLVREPSNEPIGVSPASAPEPVPDPKPMTDPLPEPVTSAGSNGDDAARPPRAAATGEARAEGDSSAPERVAVAETGVQQVETDGSDRDEVIIPPSDPSGGTVPTSDGGIRLIAEPRDAAGPPTLAPVRTRRFRWPFGRSKGGRT